MDNTKSNRSAFSIENILEQKSERKTPPKLCIPIEKPPAAPVSHPLASPLTTCENVTSSGISGMTEIAHYNTLKNLTFKNCETSSTMLPHLRNQLLTHAVQPPPPAPSHPTGNLHFDAIYDPAASLFYQQVLNLQKSSAFLMPHFQAAAAASAMANASRGTTPSVYCEPAYGQYMDCEAFPPNASAAAAALYCNAGYPGFYMPGFGVKRKGGQIRFTSQQTKNLENRFLSSKYLSPEERRHLALQLKLSDRQVKTWFQNRRAKWRRASLAKRSAQYMPHQHQQQKQASSSASDNTNPTSLIGSHDIKSEKGLIPLSDHLTPEDRQFLSDNDESDLGADDNDEEIYVQDRPRSE